MSPRRFKEEIGLCYKARLVIPGAVRRQHTQRAVPVGPRTLGQELAVTAELLGKAGLAHAHTISNLGSSGETMGRFVLISEKPTKKAYLCFSFLPALSFIQHRMSRWDA